MSMKYSGYWHLIWVLLCTFTVLFILPKITAKEVRTVSVTGTARVYVEPDEASISFTISAKDAELLTAKQKNDALLQKLNKILTDFSVEQKNLTLDYTSVNPEYKYHCQTDERIRIGYTVRQNISVKITNISQYEAFITALLNAGIDTINSTEFGNSQLKNYRDEAHSKAIQAATQKAQLFCTEAGKSHKSVRLGSVLEIREGGTGRAAMPRGLSIQNEKYVNLEAAADEISAGLVPFGVITVQAEVEMTFLLE